MAHYVSLPRAAEYCLGLLRSCARPYRTSQRIAAAFCFIGSTCTVNPSIAPCGLGMIGRLSVTPALDRAANDQLDNWIDRSLSSLIQRGRFLLVEPSHLMLGGTNHALT